jgi:sulfide:quinone oxidoreductase
MSVQHAKGKPLTAKYDGYTSCPIVLGYSSLLLAEFKCT